VTTMSSRPVAAELEATRVVLARMGISPIDLINDAPTPSAVPTFAQYVPIVSAGVPSGSRRAYGSYWKTVVEQWGDRRLDEPTPSEIQGQSEDMRANVVVRRNSRGVRSAAENNVAAMRCLYNQAVADGYIAEADNPATVDGIGPVIAARLLGRTRRASRFATGSGIANHAGVVPIEVASAERAHHRLPRGGDRQLNLHCTSSRSPRSGCAAAVAAPTTTGRSRPGRPTTRRCAALNDGWLITSGG
jgi:hypothetical protein